MWPADEARRWAVDRLVPSARNARTHTDAQVAQIAAAIREWGWTVPVLVDEDGNLIAGHGRVLAARLLGLAEVPVVGARGASTSSAHTPEPAGTTAQVQPGYSRDQFLRMSRSDVAASRKPSNMPARLRAQG